MKMYIRKYRLKKLSLNHHSNKYMFAYDTSWDSLNVRVCKANIDENLWKTCS